VAIDASAPGVIAAARLGNAGGIVIGHGAREVFIASDLAALLPQTRKVTFLADGQFAVLTTTTVDICSRDGTPAALEIREIPMDPARALKGTYEHFMLKEIMEQPEALADTIQSLLTIEPAELRLEDLGSAAERLAAVRRVVLIGMGTSLHAAMLGRSYFEQIARIPAEADNASEFRYREPVLDETTLVVSVSQSGETVDVLEAMNVAKHAGSLQVTICNTEGAQTVRVADGTVYTRAGLERGVASTKCFTTATVALYILALKLAEVRGLLPAPELHERLLELGRLPAAAARLLARKSQVQEAASQLSGARDILFLGRGSGFPVAMEGALKMKEISYIHAEGYAAGEMKHGPIALIDEDFQTVAIATRHALRSKLMSNIQQVQARGGTVISVLTDGDEEVAALSTAVLAIPPSHAALEPILATLPLQQLAYDVARMRGCDIDQPRNLAKTVTVE
jgi:glucosamine--fructose-6-phosphate aminotransferase (isomerizing)